MPFQVLKLMQLYLSIPDVMAILGDVQLPPRTNENITKISKLEKIRLDIYQVKHRPNTERHVVVILEYLLEKLEKRHCNIEFIEYEKDVNLVVKLMELCPKKDSKMVPLEVQTKVIELRPAVWPDKYYCISNDVNIHFPRLVDFLTSPLGVKFHQMFSDYLGTAFPNMQERMLKHVNAFAVEYFRWLTQVIHIEEHLDAVNAWPWTPRLKHHTMFYLEKPPTQVPHVYIRCFRYKQNGKVISWFFFHEELKLLVDYLAKFGPVKFGVPPTVTPYDVPVIHNVVDVSGPVGLNVLLSSCVPFFAKSLTILPVDAHSLPLTHMMWLPVVSPYNTHVIPSMDAFIRLVDILVRDVGYGRRVPLMFRPVEQIIEKMRVLFTLQTTFRTMIDRKVAHELMQEAAGISKKFNGRLSHPRGKLAEINEHSSQKEVIDAFVGVHRQFTIFVQPYRKLMDAKEEAERVAESTAAILDSLHLCPDSDVQNNNKQ